MNVSLTPELEKFVVNEVRSGLYQTASEVVRAGLRILDAEEKALGAASYPSGSLRHLYTGTDNRAERRTARASTMKVEAE